MAKKAITGIVFGKRSSYGGMNIYDRGTAEKVTTTKTNAKGEVLSTETESLAPKYLTELCDTVMKFLPGLQPATMYRLDVTATPVVQKVAKKKAKK